MKDERKWHEQKSLVVIVGNQTLHFLSRLTLLLLVQSSLTPLLVGFATGAVSLLLEVRTVCCSVSHQYQFDPRQLIYYLLLTDRSIDRHCFAAAPAAVSVYTGESMDDRSIDQSTLLSKWMTDQLTI